MVKMRLLEDYTHQGFDLPIGAVFAAPADDAELLVTQGVSEVFVSKAPIDDATAETPPNLKMFKLTTKSTYPMIALSILKLLKN